MTPEYQLIRSRRRRTLAIRIRAAQVEVRAPVGVSQAEIDRFVCSRRDWISQHLTRQQAQIDRHQVHICQDGRVPIGGQWLRLSWQRAARSRVQRLPEALQLTLSTRIRRNETDAVRDLLQQWFRTEAETRLIPRCKQLATLTGLHPSRVSIGHWKARWGQCSSAGEVGLNWRLLQLEPVLQDYVILHELCHLQEMNHGPRFHKLLSHHCPAHIRQRSELAQYAIWLSW